MIFDLQSLCSDGQAVTATAVSTNVLDFGTVGTPIGSNGPLSRDLGAGSPAAFRIQVNETFATLTSLQVVLQVSDDEAFGSGVVEVATSPVVVAADLVAGYVFPPQYIPKGTDKRYARLNYVVAGSDATAGQVTAGFVAGNQTA